MGAFVNKSVADFHDFDWTLQIFYRKISSNSRIQK